MKLGVCIRYSIQAPGFLWAQPGRASHETGIWLSAVFGRSRNDVYFDFSEELFLRVHFSCVFNCRLQPVLQLKRFEKDTGNDERLKVGLI